MGAETSGASPYPNHLCVPISDLRMCSHAVKKSRRSARRGRRGSIMRAVSKQFWQSLWPAACAAALAWQLPSQGRSSIARADEGPPVTLLAQVCWLESSFAIDDCTGIVHVLQRRARRSQMPIPEMVFRYSSIRSDQPRARFARSLPDGDEPSWPSSWNRRWAELRARVADTLAGRVPDPCPHATHWGARNLPTDRARAIDALAAGRWRLVQCRVETANAFYAERARTR